MTTKQELELIETEVKALASNSPQYALEKLQRKNPLFLQMLVDLLLYVLSFAKAKIDDKGELPKYRWYDFLFNKDLREFVWLVILGVVNLFRAPK